MDCILPCSLPRLPTLDSSLGSSWPAGLAKADT
jgi:hypothetical protein